MKTIKKLFKTIEGLFKTIEWLFDYWVKEFLYGPFKYGEYQTFMWEKWGDRYSAAYIKEVYNDFNKEK